MQNNNYSFFLKIVEGIREIYPQKQGVIPSKYALYISEENLLFEKMDINDILSQLKIEGYKLTEDKIEFKVYRRKTLINSSFVIIPLKIQKYNLLYRKVKNDKLVSEDQAEIFSETDYFIVGRNNYSDEINIDADFLKFPASENSISRSHLKLIRKENIICLEVLSENNKVYTEQSFSGKKEFTTGEMIENIENKQFYLKIDNGYYYFIVREM